MGTIMGTNQDRAKGHHDASSWAQSAEEARLARLRQLEVTQSHDSSDNGKQPSSIAAYSIISHSCTEMPLPSFPRHAATTGTNSISVTNPRFRRELSDEYPRIKQENSDTVDILSALEASLPPSQQAHRTRTIQDLDNHHPNLTPSTPSDDSPLSKTNVGQCHGENKKSNGVKKKQPTMTNVGSVRTSALTVRAKLAACRMKRDGRQSPAETASKNSGKAIRKARWTKKEKQRKQASRRKIPDGNETVDEEVPHHSTLPRPINTQPGISPQIATNWATPARSPRTPNTYPGPQYAAQPSFFPQQAYMPSYPMPLSQQPYFAAPMYTYPTPQPFQWQLTQQVHNQWQMMGGVPTGPAFLMERCPSCNADIRGIERDTGLGYAAWCPVCGGARGRYPQMGQWDGGWM